jgi:DNA polymerase I
MTPWLIIDVPCLCHRAFHTGSNLKWEHRPTGVIYGFFKTLQMIQREFRTENLAFCFEGHPLLRKKMFPHYKAHRDNAVRTKEELAARKELFDQIEALRTDILPGLGYQNVFHQPGMESDDLMASLVIDEAMKDMILVTSDSDLFQCLGSGVIIYDPSKKVVRTEKWFLGLYDLSPPEWAEVKAIGGCKTDNVPGVVGVGEESALKYLREELPADSRYLKMINSQIGTLQRSKSLELVKLPHPKCQPLKLVADELDLGAWDAMCDRFGMESLRRKSRTVKRGRLNYAQR